LVNRELIEVFSEIAREKNVERSELGSIIEELFLHLVERERGDASNCSVIVNLDKGEFEIYVEKESLKMLKTLSWKSHWMRFVIWILNWLGI
jgi:hypothetical protein